MGNVVTDVWVGHDHLKETNHLWAIENIGGGKYKINGDYGYLLNYAQ